MSKIGPTREECLQQVRDLEQRLSEAQAAIADLRSRLGAGSPSEVASPETSQPLIEELQAANEELQSQTEELGIQAEELQVQAEELEMQNEELQRVSEELDTERALLRTVLEQMPAGVIIAEAPSGRFLLANQQMAAIIGRAVPLAKNLHDYDHFRGFHPDGRRLLSQDYPLAYCLTSGKKTLDEEINFIRTDGSPKVIQVSATPVRNARGEIIAGVAIHQDITARKQAEREIRRLASFPQLNPNPVLEVDGAGQITYYNDAAFKAMGAMDAAEIRVFLPGDLNEIFLTANRTGQDIFHREVPVNGQVFFETISFAETLNVWRIYAVDITERQRGEEALRESQKDLNRAQAVAHTGSWRLDIRRHGLCWSDETYRIFGISPGTLLTYEKFLAAVHPEDRAYVDRQWMAALRGEPYDIEHRIVVGDSVKWVRERAELEFDAQGALLSGFGTVQDITERQQTAEALRQSNKHNADILESISDGFFSMDQEMVVTYVNNAALALWGGRQREEVLGQRLLDAFPEAEGSIFVKKYAEALREKKFINLEAFFEAAPYRNWYDVRIFPYEDGISIYFQVTTERKEREAALLRAKQDWERTFDAVPDLITIMDTDHQMVRVNRATARALGKEPQELIGRHCYEFMHASGHIPSVCPHHQLLADGREHTAELREMGREFLVTTSPILNDDGSLFGSVHIARDITERKRAEAALNQLNEELEQRVQERTAELRQTVEQLQNEVAERLEAEEALKSERQRFYDVLEMLPAYVVLLAPDYHVPFANRFFVERFGESQGMRCFEYLFGRTEPCEICETYKVLKTNAPQRWEWTGPDGRYYDIYDYPFTDVDGSPLIMEMGIDITERKQAEKRAQTIGRLYRVMSRVNEIIVRVPDRETLFRETCRIAVEDGGFRMAWVGLTDPDDQVVKVAAKYGHDQGYLDNLMISLDDAPENRGPTGVAVREGRYDLCNDFATEPRMAPWREKALARGYFSSGAFPLRLGGEVVGAIMLYAGTPGFFNQEETALLEALADDLSFALESMDREVKRRQAEEEVKKLNDELEQRVRERTAQLEAANREMEAFSYSVSHDLKAPIRAIDGFSRMLMTEHAAQLDPEALRLLEVVRHNTGHMAQLIEDLLALSRLGRRAIRKTRLDLAAMCAVTFNEIKQEDPGRRVELILKDQPSAYGDPSLMRQVLLNLLTNAFKFTKPREDAAIEVGGWGADGENIYYVKDNGVGFDMRYQDKLFGVFQRLHGQGDFEGTGVGLAIVQRILLRHGGRIWAEGKLEEGATFYFAMPNWGNEP